MTKDEIDAMWGQSSKRGVTENFDTRNAELLAKADAIGQRDPDFDMKQFTDEMWGEI